MNDDELVIVEFLKTGNLKQLHLGMSIDEVTSYLGIPDGFSVSSFKERLSRTKNAGTMEEPSWFYGCIELIFERKHDTLIFIQVLVEQDRVRNPTQPFRLPAEFAGNWIERVSKLNSGDMTRLLNDHSIQWHKHPHTPAEMLELDVDDSCVRIIFDLENAKDVLDSMISDLHCLGA